MINPGALPDSEGEWFEITNLTSNTIDLMGVEIHDLDFDTFTIDSPLVIGPNDILVFGLTAQATGNEDYIYSGMILSNLGDEIIITYGSNVIHQMVYDATFPPYGKSMELSVNHFNPSDATVVENWCVSITQYYNGDYGTPGTPNDCSL
jgi:hypothetical protein